LLLNDTPTEALAQSLSSCDQAAGHRILELFAGVGGFRHGFEQANAALSLPTCPRPLDVVWANQWEPSCARQHAATVYKARWGHAPVNRNLFEVLDDPAEMARVDALAPTMLVGGFPCQDYSVANSRAAGLAGAKGALWWAIHRLLEARIDAGRPIESLVLENVDRLINSPSGVRGRDFAVILASLQGLGYGVAWQVVNSGDYGYPQRRKRVFIVAVHQCTPAWREWLGGIVAPDRWLLADSPLARAFPVMQSGRLSRCDVGNDAQLAEASYAPSARGKSRFASAGVCIGGTAWTLATKAAPIADFTPFVGCPSRMTLGDVVASSSDVPQQFYLSDQDVERWRAAKGSKSTTRVKADGFEYVYSEGPMPFPDALDKPSRTIITSEGGTTVSRTKHVVAGPDGRLRRLTPDELDILNGFPRGFTAVAGVSDVQRAFLMGNALVTGIVARLAVAMHLPAYAPTR
jgi:DNA (cytosine-5)-methyltransferase 1